MSAAASERGYVAKSLSAHMLIGLVFGTLIYQICLTGTITVFAGELRQWEQPSAPIVHTVTPEGYAEAMRQGTRLTEAGGPPVIILGPTSALPRLEVRVPGRDGGGYADANGRMVTPVTTLWTDFVTELHENLHLPSPFGIGIVGVIGIALLAALLTGIAAHPRIFRDAFKLRRGGSARLEQADFHNRTGVWGLPFHLVVTVSGIFLALLPVLGPPIAFVAYGGDVDRAMTEMAEGPTALPGATATMPPIAAMIRQVERENAPARVSFIMLESPGTDDQVLHIDTDVPRQLATGESYRFDGNGRPLGAAGYADGRFDKQLHSAMFMLHFGSFGGLPVRLIYGLLGGLLCWLTATGMTIWLIRQRSAGRQVDHWHRLWSAVLWGQMLALACSFVASAGGVHIVGTYLVTTIAALLTSAPRVAPTTHAIWLRRATALTISFCIIIGLVKSMNALN